MQFVATTDGLWQIIYRITDWFINLLILSTVYMNMINSKQLYTNQTSSRWMKVNKMRYFTMITDLNVAQNKI